MQYPVGITNLFHLRDTGKFDVSLIAISNKTGCANTLLKSDWIWVQRNPFAKFEVDYQVALIDNANIRFINYSERVVNYFWDFGDSVTSEEFEPLHKYTHLGDCNSRLIVEPNYNFLYTLELEIKIIPLTIYSPNSFPP